uniref:Uncharacterized protein n=2 Tax=Avena sativa TaxID=4498 RepID=A0ACD5ZLC5_AVESA
MVEEEEAGGGVGASKAEAGSPSSSSAAGPVRDIRRYKCEFCDVVRSKKRLIRDHVLEHHKDEVDGLDEYTEGGGVPHRMTSHDCEECGVRFKKPAHLKQHMQSHSREAIWMCEALDPKELQNARGP